MQTIKERYESVNKRIASAANKVGRSASNIHLIAVTKHATVDEVRQLIDLGHSDFGENRLQHFTQLAVQIEEYVGRRKELGEPDLANSIRWHFIGHLQRNKCRRVLPLTRLIHTLDSLRLAEEIQEVAEKRNQVIEVLLQTNISRERQKTGIAPAAVGYLLEQLATMPHIKPRGMMCMAPAGEDPEESRPIFTRCQELFEEMKLDKHSGDAFNILSMGMSNDFEIAIECGANIVRVGSALFGENLVVA
ncbi:MAG: YggS family pyridoxal phosphate-dependent enzyme [Phycisphaerae bacterium]|nr:YggS family pyridoxal phosphate-dependent enzyme [Phycisphaerae bacterium]MBT5366257.1 YggS family pyridoxal phosphate-dependent enzyme [Phycisphaerae bacterium]MBT6268898.1 YggS family pyridoxal phosphate-dependent enzyme [Phycisphaerae bacterium]MBT6281956.1 YggS family pyridoxal phosphate-dependent enzyme [Phycisphaerae bacterium]